MKGNLIFEGFAPIKHYYTEFNISESEFVGVTLKVANVGEKYQGGIIGPNDLDNGSLSSSFVDSEEDCLNELLEIAKRKYGKGNS